MKFNSLLKLDILYSLISITTSIPINENINNEISSPIVTPSAIESPKSPKSPTNKDYIIPNFSDINNSKARIIKNSNKISSPSSNRRIHNGYNSIRNKNNDNTQNLYTKPSSKQSQFSETIGDLENIKNRNNQGFLDSNKNIDFSYSNYDDNIDNSNNNNNNNNMEIKSFNEYASNNIETINNNNNINDNNNNFPPIENNNGFNNSIEDTNNDINNDINDEINNEMNNNINNDINDEINNEMNNNINNDINNEINNEINNNINNDTNNDISTVINNEDEEFIEENIINGIPDINTDNSVTNTDISSNINNDNNNIPINHIDPIESIDPINSVDPVDSTNPIFSEPIRNRIISVLNANSLSAVCWTLPGKPCCSHCNISSAYNYTDTIVKYYGEENGELCGISDKCFTKDTTLNSENIKINQLDINELNNDPTLNNNQNVDDINIISNTQKEETVLVVPLCWTNLLPCCESCNVVSSSNSELHQYLGWENDNWCAIRKSCIPQIVAENFKNEKENSKNDVPINYPNMKEIVKESKDHEFVENTNCWSYPNYPCCNNCNSAEILSNVEKNQYLGWENDNWCGIPEECF